MAALFEKTWARRSAKIIGGVAALLLALQILLWGGFAWLNGRGGQAFVQAQLSQALQSSGYTASLSGLRLSVFGTLHIDKLDVADEAGTFLTGDDIKLHVSPALLASHILSGSLTAGAVDLRRLPNSSDAEAQPLTGFALPALYFKRANISADIKRLVLPEEMLGPDVVLAPALDAKAVLAGNVVSFDISARQQAEDKTHAIFKFLPASVTAKGNFDSQSLKLAFDDAKAEAPAYKIAAKGALGLSDDGAMDWTVQAANDDLAALTDAKLAGKAGLDVTVKGTRAAPVLAVKGALRQLVLNGKNLDDVTFDATSDHPPEGHVSLATSYQNHPVTLAGGFSWQEGVLQLTNLEGHAPDAVLTGSGSFDTATSLADAVLKANADLNAYRDILGAEVGGKGDVTLTLAPLEGHQSASISATFSDIAYQDIRLQKAAVKADMADVAALLPDSADVTVNGLRGTGFALTTLDAGLKHGTDNNYALQLKGQLQSPSLLGFNGSADLSGSSAADAAAKNIALNITTGNKTAATISGDVLADKIALALNAKALPLSLIPASLPAALANMTATGTAELSGDLAAPSAKAQLAFSPLRANAKAPAVALRLNANYAERQLTADISGSGKGITALKANAALPLDFTLKPFVFSLPESTKLQGAAQLKGDLAALGGAFLPPDIRLRGRIDADMRLGGTLAAPDAAGSIDIADGKLDQLSSGLTLRNMAVKARLAGDKLDIISASATDGEKGSLSAKGSLALGQDNAAQLTAALRHMNILRHNEAFNGTMSADLDLGGNRHGYMLKGRVTPDDIYINIPERFTSTIPKLNVIDPRKKRVQGPDMLQQLALNINMRGDDHIFVRGWGLDAEFGGTLDANGTAAAPLVNGTLESKRGRYEEFGKRFSIDHANLRFQGTVPPSPYLDVLAETVTADITAQVALTGPVAKPAIAFTSVPALPQDEVLSHILFGKGMDKISPFQAIQLTRTLQRFSGKGSGPDPLGMIRGAARLDDLNVQTDDAGATTVGAGKYVTDKVYLEVESGSGRKSGAAKVQVELTPKVKLESKVGQDAQAGAGITWGFDY